MTSTVDVVVVGCGIAGLSAALAARNAGASVICLETAPLAERGGNTTFSGGGQMTTRGGGIETLRRLRPDMSEEQMQAFEIAPYSSEDYYADIMRVTQDRADPVLARMLVEGSLPTALWLRDEGVRYRPPTSGYRDGAKVVVPPTQGICFVAGDGKGLVDQLCDIAESSGVEFRYETKAVKLLQDRAGQVCGATVKGPQGFEDIQARAVILASGGFESNREWRTRYLGPAWNWIRPRATRFNTGLGLKMALEIGAQPAGHWSGAHSASMDWHAMTETPEGQNLPNLGGAWDRAAMRNSRRRDFAGLAVNLDGTRFYDEGEDWPSLTYVRVGARVAEQPGSVAWQIFDSRAQDMLMSAGYDLARPVEADTIETLAEKIELPQLVRTVEAFNAAIPAGQDSWPPQYSVLDGQGTRGLTPPKTNWARRIERPPFRAYKVTPGITFTFGGLKINTDAQVIDTEERVIRGLYAAGNIVGFWHFNYTGGGALTFAATVGRIPGAHAAGKLV